MLISNKKHMWHVKKLVYLRQRYFGRHISYCKLEKLSDSFFAAASSECADCAGTHSHSHFTLFCTTICNLLGRHSCSISTFCLAICSTLLLAFRGDSWVIDEQETLGVARALAGRYEQDYKSPDNRLSTFLCAANRLICEVVQSRRRPLLGPSPGWKRLLVLSHLRHY